MTDQFIDTAADNADNTNTDLQNTDQSAAGSEGGVDTHSPEYQLSILQKRLQDKDEFINTLKEEGQSYREMVAQMDERLKNMEQISEVLNKSGQEQDVSNQDTNLDEDALVGKVIENLSKQEAEKRMEANWNTVVSTVEDKFGKQYVNEKVKQAADANGLSVSDMKETARKSPQAFYKLMGLDGTTRNSPQPTRSSMAPPEDNNEKDFAYYSRLMRENPREYWKPDTQREFRKLFQKQNNS